MNTPPKYTVLVVQRRLTHYRAPFFEALRVELASRGCSLRLAYGSGTRAELVKNDADELPWAIQLPTRYYFQEQLCWQPFSVALTGVDLVVVTQENKLIYNLVSQFLHKRYRVGLWGHGANLQGDPNSWRERFKRLVSKRADWWFAYTDWSLPFIERIGFPIERTTVLNNAIDTTTLTMQRNSVRPAALQKLKHDLDLQGACIGIYVGSLYTEKRIDFMLESAARIHNCLPEFEFLIVGAGPQQALVEEFCLKNSWAKYLGICKGPAKVEAMALAQVMLNPGAVGLSVLDSFVCSVPVVTTSCSTHGPEISYLRNGENGLVSPNSVDEYVASTVGLLKNQVVLAKLKAGCELSAKEYTVENMARHFADGVIQCLSKPMYRRAGAT